MITLVLATISAILYFPVTYVLLFYVFYRIKQDSRFRGRPILGHLYNLPAVLLAGVGYAIGVLTLMMCTFDPFYTTSDYEYEISMYLYGKMLIVPVSTTVFYLIGFWMFRKFKRTKAE